MSYQSGEYYYYELTVTLTTPSGTSSDISPSGPYGPETLATLTELSDFGTPSSSPAGTVLDTDDDGDGVSDADEATAGTDPLDTDSDDDGDDDLNDQFPLNSAEWDDTDGDAPAGSDGTGYGDNSDDFPTDACANVDTDGDGQPDTIISGCSTTLTEDVDDDADGVLDTYDAFPLDASETTDTDGDGTGNNADTDDDGDAWPDAVDWAPLDSSEWLDSDGDGIGNSADSDDDNDGTPDGSDTYPRDYDNDGWDDAWETACGTSTTSATSYPADYDADSSGDSGSVDSAGAPNGVNLCDSVDPDDDNDGYLDPVTLATMGGQYTSFSSLTETFTLTSGSKLTVTLTTYSWGSEAGLTINGVDMGSFSSNSVYTWSYTDAGSYTITLTDSWGDGGQLVTAVGAEDQFQYDYEAWYDTDGDGLTDYIDPNSTITAYTTVTLCSEGGTMSNPSFTALSCTFTLPAGETLDITLTTTSWASEAGLTMDSPTGTTVNLETSGGYSSFTNYGTYTWSYTDAGSYTLDLTDSWGDGGQSVVASYTYISGTTVPSVTTYGTYADSDDDGDGYSDLDEGDAYAVSYTHLTLPTIYSV